MLASAPRPFDDFIKRLLCNAAISKSPPLGYALYQSGNLLQSVTLKGASADLFELYWEYG